MHVVSSSADKQYRSDRNGERRIEFRIMSCNNGGRDQTTNLSNCLGKICVAENENVSVEPGETDPPLDSENDAASSSQIPPVVIKEDPEIRETREKLPIFLRKAELLEAFERSRVLIVVGETGSGKTTQIPQFLKEIGVADRGRIGCTQLRRVAAKRIAERVAREQGCELGEEVGYTIRFEDRAGPNTKIQFMTEGILLNEAVFDRTLSSYSAIIVDEAHERGIETDVLLGVLRWAALEVRKDLRVIISSATLDYSKFAHFFNAPVFHIDGRMFPVKEFYCPLRGSESYISAAAIKVRHINETEGDDGNILVFMTGQGDIIQLCEDLATYENSPSSYPELVVLPYYSTLPEEEQAKVFEPVEEGKRKVIVATNIAETSLTLDNIRFVVDSGLVKQKTYDHQRRMEILKNVKVSQAQAVQRAGRAGRVASGKCFRLYPECDFKKFARDPEPEITRSTLTRAVLILKTMNFNDLSVFHFIDAPPAFCVHKAEEELALLSAIDANGEITKIGKKMASFPVDPCLAKMLVASEELNCAEEILTIVALLSVPDIFDLPRRNLREEAERARAAFFTNDGDLITMLNVYNAWLANNKEFGWCKEKYIHSRFMHEACQIRVQLQETMIRENMSINSVGGEKGTSILESICSGLILNTAALTYGGVYVTREKENVFIHPGSVFCTNSSVQKLKPSWVVYYKVIHTSRSWLKGITPVRSEWIDNFTPSTRPPTTSEFDESLTSFPIHDPLRPLQRKRMATSVLDLTEI